MYNLNQFLIQNSPGGGFLTSELQKCNFLALPGFLFKFLNAKKYEKRRRNCILHQCGEIC
jgi:hypothetical protein